MERRRREEYFKYLSDVKVEYKKEVHDNGENEIIVEYHIEEITFFSSKEERENIKKIPTYHKLNGICMQDFQYFKIYYPEEFVFNWPRDIWLPNCEAEDYLLEALKKTENGMLGYWNEDIFLFITKFDHILKKQCFLDFFKHICSIDQIDKDGLVIKARYDL